MLKYQVLFSEQGKDNNKLYMLIVKHYSNQTDGVLIESMDACMGLTRKKAKGTNVGQPRHGTLVFSDQDDVDNFVDNYTNDATKPQEVMKLCLILNIFINAFM